MSMSRWILLDHAHIRDQHIPSFVDSIVLVIHDHEHVTLHTPRSCPHWRSTHTFLHRFNSPSTTWSWTRHICILLDHAHIGDQHIPSFVNSIRLVLHDDEHITLHTTWSCPHWRSTHPFLHRLDSPSTTWSWARHIAYYSIMPTLEINTSLPSSIRFA
jgi:hypothetical protein